MYIEFTCPVCSQHEMEEVRSAFIVKEIIDSELLVTLESDIMDSDEYLELYYGCEDIQDRDLEEYRCGTCGHIIASGRIDLLQFLRENKMLIED